MDRSQTLVLIVLLGFSAAILRLLSRTTTVSSMPPGPTQKDITAGNVTGNLAIEAFKSCREQFGPVFTIRRAIGPPIVIVADYEAGMSILEKEGAASTADRPRVIAGAEIYGRGMLSSQMRAGALHSKFRKGLSAALRPSIAVKYASLQEEQAMKLVLRISHSPLDFGDHLHRFAADLAISIAYGHSSLAFAPPTTTPRGSSPENIRAQIRIVMDRFLNALQPGAFLVDSLPILAYLPGWLYWPRRKLDQGHLEMKTLYRGMLEGVRKARVDDANLDAKASFGSYILDNQISLGLSEIQLAFLGSSIFGAASDTTSAALGWIIQAAAAYPGAQKAVQDQLDEVVGKDRAPLASDEPNLSAVVAFYMESYRWRPTVPGGFPHRATKDVVWNGYTIPKGTTIYGNHWLMGRSPSLFPDPESFDHQRWLYEKDGHVHVRDDLKPWSFGFGRRACPGIHVANRSVFIATAMLLWAFNITTDEPLDTMRFSKGVNVRPLPFRVRFERRISQEEMERAFGVEI